MVSDAQEDQVPVRLDISPDVTPHGVRIEASDDHSRLHEMALGMYEDGSLEETVEKILGFALSAIQCEHAALIMQGKGGRLELVAATDPLINELDLLQREEGAGPDVDMVEYRLGVLVTDTRTDRRWPRWAERANSLGIRSMLGARLYTDRATVGTLNLYDTRENYFDLDDQAVANVLSRHAAIALARTRHLDNLWQAIDARKRIGQAQGILMERYSLNEDQAFQILLRYSQDMNLKLRAVAEEVVLRRTLPEPG